MTMATWTCPFCGEGCDVAKDRCEACGGRRPDGFEPEVGPEKPAGIADLRCLRCDGPLREGFCSHKLSPVRPRSVFPPVQWYEGPVQWSEFWGYHAAEKGRPVRVYRCERCGRLELFADA